VLRDADNRGGARQAVEYLARTGRRRIVTIAGPPDVSAGVDRLAGFREGWSERAWTRARSRTATSPAPPGNTP
jgi:DNA-binding LacI/PurR family transcriptional regulator